MRSPLQVITVNKWRFLAAEASRLRSLFRQATRRRGLDQVSVRRCALDQNLNSPIQIVRGGTRCEIERPSLAQARNVDPCYSQSTCD
jgi:hypothetical protein